MTYCYDTDVQCIVTPLIYKKNIVLIIRYYCAPIYFILRFVSFLHRIDFCTLILLTINVDLTCCYATDVQCIVTPLIYKKNIVLIIRYYVVHILVL